MRNELQNAIKSMPSNLETPFYVFDLARMEEAIEMFRGAFSERNIPLKLAYSIKTNPNTNIVRFLLSRGLWGEVTCGEEMELVDPQSNAPLIFNGIYKTAADYALAIRRGAYIILDGLRQLDQLTDAIGSRTEPVKVGIRLSTHPFMNDAGNRFGLPYDGNEVRRLINTVGASPFLDLKVLHINIGTNVRDTAHYFRGIRHLLSVMKLVERNGGGIKFLDIGGGMPAPLQQSWLADLCRGISQELGAAAHSTCVIAEPGRSIVEQAGYLVTTVVDVRARVDSGGRDIILDAGTNSVMGHTYGSSYHCFPLIDAGDLNESPARVFGPLCSASDMIKMEYWGRVPAVGERFVVAGVGAYDYSTSYQFGRRSPAACFLDHSGALTLSV